MLRDDDILRLAETTEIDLVDYMGARTVADAWDGDDVAQWEPEPRRRHHGDAPLDIRRAMHDATRDDILLVIANRFGPMVSPKAVAELRGHAAIIEQLAVLRDDERAACFEGVFREIAGEVLRWILRQNGAFNGIDMNVRENRLAAENLVSDLAADLGGRLDMDNDASAAGDIADPASKETADEIEQLIAEVGTQSVDLAAIVDAAEKDLHWDEENDQEQILSIDARNHDAILRAYDALLRLGGGRMTIVSLMRFRENPELARELLMIDEEERDACFCHLFTVIAERAILENPRFDALVAKLGDPDAIVADCLMTLLERNGFEA